MDLCTLEKVCMKLAEEGPWVWLLSVTFLKCLMAGGEKLFEIILMDGVVSWLLWKLVHLQLKTNYMLTELLCFVWASNKCLGKNSVKNTSLHCWLPSVKFIWFHERSPGGTSSSRIFIWSLCCFVSFDHYGSLVH